MQFFGKLGACVALFPACVVAVHSNKTQSDACYVAGCTGHGCTIDPDCQCAQGTAPATYCPQYGHVMAQWDTNSNVGAAGSCPSSGPMGAGPCTDSQLQSFTMWSDKSTYAFGPKVIAIEYIYTDGTTYRHGADEAHVNANGQLCVSAVHKKGDRIKGETTLFWDDLQGAITGISYEYEEAGTGKVLSVTCGNGYKLGFLTDGQMFSRFFGTAGAWLTQLGFYTRKACKVISRQITSMECVSPSSTDGHTCVGTWTDSGTTSTASSNCNACKSRQQLTCTTNFQQTMSTGVTTASTGINELGGSVTVGEDVHLGFMVADARFQDSVQVNYQHTWESSKSTSTTKTWSIASTCSVQMVKPFHQTQLSGTFHVGTINADIKIHVVEVDDCGGSTPLQAFDGSVTLTNIPTHVAVGSCTATDIPCPEGVSDVVV